ncbi:MAG: serine hydrolase domain-containing protein, partial [Pyrinomonadaceae bacterium]
AYGYTQKESGFEKTDQSLTSSTLADGSVYSSVDDLFKWEQALYTTRLVSADTLKRALSVGAKTDDLKLGYGFGWFIGDYRGLTTIYHGGNTVGFTSVIRRFPEQKFAVIVLTNRNAASLAEVVNKIEDMYLFDCK